MKLNHDEKTRLSKFQKWINRTFQKVQLDGKPKEVFCCKSHNDRFGNLVINHGTMVLEKHGENYTLLSIDSGITVMIDIGPSLEGVLIRGVQESVKKAFEESYVI